MRLLSILVFGTALAVAAVAIGGVHTPVAVAVCSLAFLALVFQWLHLRGRTQSGMYVSMPVIGLLLLFGASVLQVIPLPELVQRVLSPEGHDLVNDGLAAAGFSTEGAWRTISMDPGATSDRALRFAALAMMGLFAANLRSRQAWVVVGRAILGTAFLVLLVGGALYVTKTRDIPGLYTSVVGFRAPGTFVNLNHGATFFGLAALVGIALGLGAERRRVIEGAGFWAAALLFAVIGAMHDSDGVALAFAASVAIGALVLWNRAGRPTNVNRETKIASAVLAVLAVGLAAWLDLFEVGQRFFRRLFFEGEHGNRLELMRAGAAMVSDFWPAGAGAGAVETLIPGYMNWQSTTVGATIPVLENDTLELLFGFGIFMGGIAIAAAASIVFFAWRYAFDEERTLRYAMVLPSAFYLFVLAQLHFPLFALGVGVPAIVWLESLMSRRVHDGADHSVLETGHILLPMRWGAALVLAVAVVAGGVGVAHYTTYKWELPETLDAEQARRAIELRPSDHRIYVRLATQAAREGRADDTVRLAQFARSRNALPRVRLFLARAKAFAKDAEGARYEYAALLKEDHGDVLLIRGVLADFEDPQDRVEIFADYPELWDKVAQTALRLQGGPAAADFALALVDAKPNNARAYKVATETYLSMKQPFLAQLWAELLMERDAAEDVDGVVLLARALLAAGNRPEATRLLERAIAQDPDTPNPELHRIALGLRPGAREATPEQVESIRMHYDLLCKSPVPSQHLRLCWESEAWLAEQEGDLPRVQVLLERVERKFNDPGPLLAMLLRYQMCHEISRMSTSTDPESPHAARIDEMVKRCVHAAGKE